MVFNRCVKDNNLHIEDEDYQITLYFEFLEDVYADWSESGDGTASETSSQASFSMEDIPEEEQFQKIRGRAGVEEAITQLEKKTNHPLMIMVRKYLARKLRSHRESRNSMLIINMGIMQFKGEVSRKCAVISKARNVCLSEETKI